MLYLQGDISFLQWICHYRFWFLQDQRGWWNQYPFHSDAPIWRHCKPYSQCVHWSFLRENTCCRICPRYVHPRQLINTKEVSNISIIEPPSSAYGIKVWELNNYSTGEWSMKHMIYFHELVSPDSLLTLYTMRGCPNSEVLFFHPNDADTVLLMLPKLVAECNLKDKTIKRVCNFSKQLQKVYGVAFPWWPSPLPSIM